DVATSGLARLGGGHPDLQAPGAAPAVDGRRHPGHRRLDPGRDLGLCLHRLDGAALPGRGSARRAAGGRADGPVEPLRLQAVPGLPPRLAGARQEAGVGLAPGPDATGGLAERRPVGEGGVMLGKITQPPFVQALGGWRASGFALLATVALAGLGVQSLRLTWAEAREAKLQAAAATYQAAQQTNLDTIASLRARLQALADARRAEREAQAQAVARAQEHAQALQRDLDARTADLRRLYAQDPAAARWG